MPASLKRYLIKAAIVTASTYITGFFFYISSLKKFYLPIFIYLPAFFMIINSLVFLFILKAAQKNPYKFNSYFMLTSALKLFIYFAFIIIYFFAVRTKILEFAVVFFSLYLVFTFFETREILGTLKKEKNNT
ncbi:MAG: hypothetical protein JXB49_01925 [Bacteroidales bacterium]|nr:hypothetical protein [Bacteroidales bacterium]